MEAQEHPLQHFEAMAKLAGELRTVPAQILEHAYNHGAFGSWWTTVQCHGITFRIVFDGKDRQLRLERAGAPARTWTMLKSWSAANDEAAQALRDIAAHLGTV